MSSDFLNKQQVTVLGATGSIGTSTLDVLQRHPERYAVYALTANTRWQAMLPLCLQHQPRFAVMQNPDAAEALRTALGDTDCETQVLAGDEALCQVAGDEAVDVVMAAIVGAAGLAPSLAAVREGKRVLLANKEALVMTGDLFMQEVAQHGATLLPIDSEHNALFQCLPQQPQGVHMAGVSRLQLTASGGPFRRWTHEQMQTVTPEQAVAHPNWSMGAKISVDSASMMNKGLEIIEACWLYGVSEDQVDVVVHPQSTIHSLVSYVDGSVLAQLGNPDMRTPIAHALAWPERIDAGVGALDLIQLARLDFEAPDEKRFPCLRLAREAFRRGGTACALLNAANEVAVAAFLDRRCGFMHIPHIVETVLSEVPVEEASLEVVLEADQRARDCANRLVISLGE